MVQTLFDNIIKWSACVLTMCGAVATTQGIDPANVFLLTIGGTLYLIWSIRIREWNLIVVNIAMLMIYGYGTVLRLVAYFA
jgi:uncharacterized membrane protein